MQDIAEVVEMYLKMDTSYAVMISGPWGSGKTYFIRNTIIPLIEGTPLYHDNSRYYHPVLISLFGQKSIGDIQADILISLYPILGNKFVKLGGSLFKGLFKGALKLSGLEQFADTAADVHVDKKDLIKFEELVLIFDDLERRHRELPMEELLGFVNSLVETGNNKILLIANEGAQDDPNYHNLKEKTVGVTVHFQPVLTDSMKNILETRFSAYPTYQQYLTDNFEAIAAQFLANSSNLRVFSFWLSYFQLIYSDVDTAVAGIISLQNLKSEILSNFLGFSMAIAIEYKAGRIGYGQTNDLERQSRLSVTEMFAEKLARQGKKEKDTEKKYYQIFAEQYYGGRSYFFFPSIFALMTGGGKLRVDQLRDDLKRQYHVTDIAIPPHYERYNQLQYVQVYELEESDYIRLTQQLLEDAEDGKFELDSYPTIFHFLIRFNNPLNLDPVQLKDRIIAGIRRGRDHYTYAYNLKNLFRISASDEHHVYLSEIVAAGLAVNEDIKKTTICQQADELQEQFFQGSEAFYQAVAEKKGPHYLTPVFDRFPVDRTFQYLMSLNNKSLVQFIDLVRTRFKEADFPGLAQERSFFVSLANKMDQEGSLNPDKGLRWFILDDLYAELKKYKDILVDPLP